jgi:hypothetical protein
MSSPTPPFLATPTDPVPTDTDAINPNATAAEFKPVKGDERGSSEAEEVELPTHHANSLVDQTNYLPARRAESLGAEGRRARPS